MSMFAFGVMLLADNAGADSIALAKKLTAYHSRSSMGFWLKWGGNANSYHNYMRHAFYERGLHFEITNSLVENTAEAIYSGLPPMNSGEDSMTQEVLRKHLTDTQALFQYAFSTGLVKAIRFCIVDDPGPITKNQFRTCASHETAKTLAAYYEEDGTLYDTVCLTITP